MTPILLENKLYLLSKNSSLISLSMTKVNPKTAKSSVVISKYRFPGSEKIFLKTVKAVFKSGARPKICEAENKM